MASPRYEQQASQSAAAPSPIASPMERALSGLHAELSALEELAGMLERRLAGVLEHNMKDISNEGTDGVAPMPTAIVNVLGCAEARISALRNKISEMLDRLHL